MKGMLIELPVVVEGAFDEQGVDVHRSTKYTESHEQSSHMIPKQVVTANFECMGVVHCLKHNRAQLRVSRMDVQEETNEKRREVEEKIERRKVSREGSDLYVTIERNYVLNKK